MAPVDPLSVSEWSVIAWHVHSHSISTCQIYIVPETRWCFKVCLVW